ncbi:MAG: hypothetical protein LLG04_03715 [Parachlamydia sp.]|nr:hypothetical protein [Parachlamydia sp.]
MEPAVGITDDASRRQREEAVFNPARCLSGYIKEMHGNKQALFNKESGRIVYEATKALKDCVKSPEEVPTIWKNLLEKLAKERSALAVKQGALRSEQFGQWLDQDGKDTYFNTNLVDSHYQAYGNQILSNIQSRLRQIIKEQGSDTRKGLCKGWGDENSRFFVRVFNREDIQKAMNVSAEQIIPNKEAVQQAIKGYQGNVTTGEVQVPFPDLTKGFYQINTAYPSAATLKRPLLPGESDNTKSAFILLVNVLKIEGVWRAMTGYLTWVYEDEPYQLTSKVIDLMSEDCGLYHGNKMIPRKKSQVMILHSCTKEQQDAVFRDTARIVKEVLRWDGKDQDQLRDQLSEIAYKLILLNPTFRGWAAICKWTDCILWKFHNLELIPYHPEKQMDLEIHANPYMPNFIKKNRANFDEGKSTKP